jgi:hypothetical protein
MRFLKIPLCTYHFKNTGSPESANAIVKEMNGRYLNLGLGKVRKKACPRYFSACKKRRLGGFNQKDVKIIVAVNIYTP